VPILGRRTTEVDDLIGCFTQLLPVRVSVNGGASGRELVRSVAARLVAAQDHASVGAADVVATLRDETRRTTPIDSIVSAQWRRVEDADATRDGTTFEAVARPPRAPGLQLRIDEVGARVVLRVGGTRSGDGWIDADAVVDALVARVAALVRAPDVPITGGGRSGAPRAIAARMDVLAHQAPDAPAIERRDLTMTRRELEQWLARAVAGLHARGVERGDVVAVAVGGIGGALAIHAVWRAGAVALPIDPAAPPAYRDRLVALAAARVVLASEDDVAGLASDDSSAADAAAVCEPAAPCSLIFTSGSTGAPAGVVVSHGAVAAYVDGMVSVLALAPSDRMLLVHSLAFDASLEEIGVALVSGATLVEAPRALGSARELMCWCDELGITALALPTALWHELALQVADGDVAPPASLRLVCVGGQAARADLVAAWQQNCPDVRLVNGYGPTETTVEVTTADLSRADLRDGVPIGRPLAHAEVMVVGRDGGAVDDASAGELWISGAQLALGYLADRERTDARFVARDGRRWYRSGDLVRRNDDGELVYVGRLDGQLKVRGVRIEPLEIETVLAAHDDVQEAVVVARDASLVAHVVARAGRRPERGALLEHCARALPSHLVPNRVELHDALPRTFGGKPDRTELARDRSPGVSPARSVAGADSLLDAWRCVLDVPDLGPDDDCFAAGATSLHAVRLVAATERALGRPVPLAAVLEHRSVRGVLAAVDADAPPAGVVRFAGDRQAAPLFLVPPGGGELLVYRDLVANLGDGLAVYGFEVPGLDGVTLPLRGQEATVAWYADRIRAVQPHGPYRIAGFSLGAFVAVDVARVLYTGGEAVRFVGMIDPNFKIATRSLRGWIAGDRSKPLLDILRAGVALRVARARRAMLAARLRQRKRRTSRQAFELLEHEMHHHFRTWEHRPFDEPVVVFRATGTEAHPRPLPVPDPTEAYLSAAHVVPVTGRHDGRDSMLHGEHANALAAAMRDAIAACDDERSEARAC
jgi:amino acid adenylation domain-containing protein